jgi:hypothetical protein
VHAQAHVVAQSKGEEAEKQRQAKKVADAIEKKKRLNDERKRWGRREWHCYSEITWTRISTGKKRRQYSARRISHGSFV